MNLKDTGERVEHAGGAISDPSNGRGKFDLIPTRSLRRLAKHYENGAKKYASRNWEGGIPYSVAYDKAMSHLIKWFDRLDDEDHLAAFVWWGMAAMHFEDTGRTDLDDRPKYDLR